MIMKATAHFRRLLKSDTFLALPGVYDGITARLSEQAGFKSIYMTGAGTSVSMGLPDFGLLTLSEMVDRAAIIARSVEIPLIADADTGYGNELNVTRTVREYERSGAAGIHIEDQVAPKRCGHVEGKEVVSLEEFIVKIQAAVAARLDPDFFIIARTDARAVIGFEEALTRANAAMAAGADMAFVEAVQSGEEMAAVPRRVNGPCLFNMVGGGKTPPVSLPDVQELGYQVAIMPGALLGPIIKAVDEALVRINETQMLPPQRAGATPMDTFRRFGADEWNNLRREYPPASPTKNSISSLG
jgi:2-methylisocitrate lyase-like PEP mutase family enzyme